MESSCSRVSSSLSILAGLPTGLSSTDGAVCDVSSQVNGSRTVAEPQPVCAGKLKFSFPNVEDLLIKFHSGVLFDIKCNTNINSYFL